VRSAGDEVDRVGLDHRQARRHLDAGVRRHVRVGDRSRALDLGYHMAVVVAIVFFVIRASLALMPGAVSDQEMDNSRANWCRPYHEDPVV
jgi:hypothetical protein